MAQTRWIIAYKGARGVSYFDTMTAIGPKFGAGVQATPRYLSRIEAERAVAGFPATASVSCFVMRAPKAKVSR